jgi:hypothetical protein
VDQWWLVDELDGRVLTVGRTSPVRLRRPKDPSPS